MSPRLQRTLALLATLLMTTPLVGCSSDEFSAPASADSKCKTPSPGFGGTWTGVMGGSALTITLQEECTAIPFLCTFCTSEWKVSGTFSWKDVTGSASYGSFGGSWISLTRPGTPVSGAVLLEIQSSSGSPVRVLTVRVAGTLETSNDQNRPDLRPPEGMIDLVRR